MGKVNFEDSKTMVNLARSFSGECMQGAKYQFLASSCEEEELEYVKTILKTLAKHEMSHAKIFWKHIQQNTKNVLKNIDMNFGYPFENGKLTENFKYNAQNELELSEHVYPAFAKIAKDEGYEDIAHTFLLVASVEEWHNQVLMNIHGKLKTNALYKATKNVKWQCNECGFEHTAKEALKVCPLCCKEQGYVEIEVDK